MAGLLADGWFYISSAGLLVSGVLFFFLLSQYRAATDAADQPEAEAAAEAHPIVRPLSISEGAPAPAKVASYSAETPVEKAPAAAKPAPVTAPSEPAATPVEKRRENTTGGINPAVVYLQNIKNQLEEIHQENRELAKRVEAITSRDEALIERLSELAEAVAELKSKAPTSVPPDESAPSEPVPKRAKKSPAPAPAVAQVEVPAAAPEPAAAPAPEPVAAAETVPLTIEPTTTSGVGKPVPKTEPTAESLFSPDETVRLEMKPAAAPAPAEPSAAAPEAAEEPEPDRPRRGPVWPV